MELSIPESPLTTAIERRPESVRSDEIPAPLVWPVCNLDDAALYRRKGFLRWLTGGGGRFAAGYFTAQTPHLIFNLSHAFREFVIRLNGSGSLVGMSLKDPVLFLFLRHVFGQSLGIGARLLNFHVLFCQGLFEIRLQIPSACLHRCSLA